MRHFNHKITGIIFCFLFLFKFAEGQVDSSISIAKDTSENTPNSIFQYLSNEKITKLTITTDIKKLLKNQQLEEPEYQLAVLSFSAPSGQIQEWDVSIRARGKRRKDYCLLPPVKINFHKKDLKENALTPDFDKLKIVNHCNKGMKSEAYLLREYLAYKIYNILTDNSFRVKLLRIEYKDSEGKKSFNENYAIILENTKEMARRIGGVEYELPRYYLNQVRNEVTANMDLFQYMIGNTDYRISAYHNLKMVKMDSSRTIFPVAYDFDYSGLVNTNYSAPQEGLLSDDVRQRVFLGLCQSDETWEKVLQNFKNHEKEIIALVEDFDLLKKPEKKFAYQYLKIFFKMVHSKSRLQSTFQKRCIE